MRLPRALSRIRNATLADGSRVDLELGGDTVTAIVSAGLLDPADADGDLDLEGFVLLTAPADPHAHLDKALSWDAIRPPMGDLLSAIDSWRAYSATMTERDVADRARTMALAMLAQGTTAIRSHVDVLRGDDPMLCIRALVSVREELVELMNIELVVLAGPDVPDEQVEEALDLGADLVGGAPHLATDPSADLQRLLAIAHRRRVGVDLHTDESLHGPVTLGELARSVRGWEYNVAAGHCVRLGSIDPSERDEIIAQVVASDVGIIANPITNLYLQGWEHEHSAPRGITAARQLIDAGARFAAGADNVRDPFNPLGRGDALETAMLLVTAGHLTIDEAYTAVSTGARAVMGLTDAGPRVGARADLLAIRGTDLADAVAQASAARHVIHRGALVASTSVHTTVAAPRVTTPAHHDLEMIP